ncbi:MAG: HAD hydrolase-like protein [Dehalococcoidales bacterium]|nr:HAD hydrolase-like protein [Dehalococcoidales bacterium]
MKYKAVIFDLGGTLVRNVGWGAYEEAALRIAEQLSAPVDEFTRQWFEESSRLGTGDFTNYSEYIRYTCSEIGYQTPEDKLHDASDIMVDVSRRLVAGVRNDAIELLSWLKSRNYRTGLISDCFSDIPALWDSTPFASLIDVAVFSCFEKRVKSDIRIFHTALNKLAVSPDKCMYIADGMRNELTNAASLGMQAVQIYLPKEIDHSPIREDWKGTVISSLSEIKNLLEGV